MSEIVWYPRFNYILYSLHSSQERKKHLGTFSVHVRLTVLELASLEKKKEELKKKEENDDFRFFSKFVFLASINGIRARGHIYTQEGQG